ncbi:MAG TPA: hypothetical protein VGX25_31630 [Actinophytocola sp.]|uniref:hypothetical protein n=1 Tax=Actinophytocola sp. TaxID=1872138 RepID=UPI002DDDB4BA|nr:hypothetical protein [Actinophytocola sp.]HEV2783962.1 hypothetical protein [Actinophytocola sp.]
MTGEAGPASISTRSTVSGEPIVVARSVSDLAGRAPEEPAQTTRPTNDEAGPAVIPTRPTVSGEPITVARLASDHPGPVPEELAQVGRPVIDGAGPAVIPTRPTVSGEPITVARALPDQPAPAPIWLPAAGAAVSARSESSTALLPPFADRPLVSGQPVVVARSAGDPEPAPAPLAIQRTGHHHVSDAAPAGDAVRLPEARLVPVEVQRQEEIAAPAPAVGPQPAPQSGAAPAAGQDPEELVKKLFDPLLRRLKTELLLDRERRGRLTDLSR